jgi:hypothetical protein
MERSLTFLHRQTAILRAALEPLTDADRQRLKEHGLGSSSLGNGMVSEGWRVTRLCMHVGRSPDAAPSMSSASASQIAIG